MAEWCGQTNAGGWVGTVAIWVLVVVVVVWAVSRLFTVRDRRKPRAVLDARLASGQIDAETYRAIRTELDGVRVGETRGTR